MRQSGRTTAMLYEAAEAVERGERVLIVTPAENIERIIYGLVCADEYLSKNLGRSMFVTSTHVRRGRVRGRRLDGYFLDHTVSEMLSYTGYKGVVDELELALHPPPPKPMFKFSSF